MSVNIPKKCSEPWHGMIPATRGKFCSTCNLEVIDFTDWKTEDIISYVQRSTTKVCGRVLSSQSTSDYKLQLLNTRQLSKLGFGLALSGLLFTKSLLAESLVRDNSNVYLLDQQGVKDSITIQGVVTDLSDKPLAEVVIRNVLNNKSFSTDKEGRFAFKFLNSHNLDSLPLSIHFIGYKTKDIKHDLSKNENIKIKLEEHLYEIGEIIVKPLKRKPRKG